MFGRRRSKPPVAAPGEQVCATLKDGKPVYFVMPVDVPDAAVRAEAFRIREGRPMSHIEKLMLDIAERHAQH